MIGVNHLHMDPILASDKKQSNHKLWQGCDSRITERQKGSFKFSGSTIYMGSGWSFAVSNWFQRSIQNTNYLQIK